MRVHKTDFVRVLLVLVSFALISPQLVAQQTDYDKIYLKGNQQAERGIVKKETLQNLVWAPAAQDGGTVGETKSPWEEVRNVEYGNIPSKLSKAKSLYEKGENPAKVIQLLNTMIEEDNVDREVFRQQAFYLRGKVLYEIADSKEAYGKAASAYEEALKRFPRYKDYISAAKNRIKCYMEQGNMDKALEAADELANRDLGSKVEAIASFMKGKVYESQGNCEEAIEFFKDSADADDVGIANKSKLAIGNCHLKSGDMLSARAQYESVLKGQTEGLSETALAGAHNGMGRILFEEEYKENAKEKAAKKKNVKVLKNAILHFLRGVIMYQPGPGESTKETERSLYWTARAFAALAVNVENSEKASEHQQEALRVLNTLLQDYPNTFLREKAQRLRRKIQS